MRQDPVIPRLGWSCKEVIDSREQEIDYEEYEDCQLCGHERIRFVHVMCHDDFDGTLRVGCVCAGRMSGDPDEARREDREARNRAKRYENFRKKRWERTVGGMELRYRGVTIRAFVKPGHAAILECCGEVVREHLGRPIDTNDALREAAFELLESKMLEHRLARGEGGTHGE